MRPIHVSVIAGLSLATLGVSQAEIEGEISAGFNNEYIWRGIDQGGDGMVEAAVDLNTSYFGLDFNFNVWYASVNGSDNFNEVNYSYSTTKDFGWFAFTSGHIWYDFPDSGSSAQEHFFGISKTVYDFDLAYTYYWDIDEDNDGYSELTVDRSFDLSECLTLDAGGTLSYDWETGNLHHWGLSVGLNWAYNDVLTVSPYISATFAEDGAKTGALSGYDSMYSSSKQGDELFGGIIISAAF